MPVFRLNPQQQEAVDTIDGALLLLAGAGSGKTRVIVERIGNMVRRGVYPSNILAVTFTNKAAREMEERVAAMGGMSREHLPTMSTFHSFCIRVMHQHANLIGYSGNFTIATEGYQKGLLRDIASELQWGIEGIDPYTWLSQISLCKANMQTPGDMEKLGIRNAEKVAAIYRRYQERMKLMNMMDFDDILCNTVKLWKARPDVLKQYQEQYRYLMIDEYQDTNSVQLELMVLLAGERQNICAVGDDDQSIYGWRGANQQNILDFEKFFPGAKVIRLEQNYRSTNTILKAANALIAKNARRRSKNLWSDQGEGEKISSVQCEDGGQEAEFVAREVENLAVRGRSITDRTRKWDDYAILYRASSQARLFEDAFRKRRIPFVVVGSKSFYERKEILDVITLLELAVNLKNDMAFRRIVNVPPRGVGDGTLGKMLNLGTTSRKCLMDVLSMPEFLASLDGGTAANLKAFEAAIRRCAQNLAEPGPVLPRVRSLLEELQYMDKLILMYKPRSDAMERKENVMEFLNSVNDYDILKKYKGTLPDFLETLALKDANDHREKGKDVTENAVSFMTIHASKGLEFNTVFLVGMEQGLFPHAMAIDEGNLEEERRLCYVAITRARKKLYMTYAEKRRIMNAVCVKRLSMFVTEVPREFKEPYSPKMQKEVQKTSQEESDCNWEAIRQRLKGG